MVWVIGKVSPDEIRRLAELGWQDEDPPTDWQNDDPEDDSDCCRAYWVDSDVLDVMTGPDWETGYRTLVGQDGVTAPGLSELQDRIRNLNRESGRWIKSVQELLTTVVLGRRDTDKSPLPPNVQQLAYQTLLIVINDVLQKKAG